MPLSHAVEKFDLAVGDHIYVYKWVLAYSHHAIVVSCDDCKTPTCTHSGTCCEVVHLKRTGEVTLESLSEFLCGSQMRRFQYGASTAEALMKRAGSCSTLEPDPWFAATLRALALVTPEGTKPAVAYSVFSRNCELFALWCKTGYRSGIKDFIRDSAASSQSSSAGILKAATAVAAAGTVIAAVGPELVIANVTLAASAVVANGMRAVKSCEAPSTDEASSSSSVTHSQTTASSTAMPTEQPVSVCAEASANSVPSQTPATVMPTAIPVPMSTEEPIENGSTKMAAGENAGNGHARSEQRCRVHSVLRETLSNLGLALPLPLEEQCLFGSQNQYFNESQTKQCQAVATVCDLLAASVEDPNISIDDIVEGKSASEPLSETTAFMRLQECLFEFTDG